MKNIKSSYRLKNKIIDFPTNIIQFGTEEYWIDYYTKNLLKSDKESVEGKINSIFKQATGEIFSSIISNDSKVKYMNNLLLAHQKIKAKLTDEFYNLN